MDDDHDRIEAFVEAVRLAKGQSAFARAVGCSQGNIWQLLKKRSPLPGRFVIKAEAATGVSRHRLRPDLYPLSDVPAERTVGNGAPIVSCDRSAGLQPAE